MPWTAKDAKRFKKGLSPEQAKKWAKIANSVLRQCLSDGGSNKTCEARAIKIANAKVGKVRTGSVDNIVYSFLCGTPDEKKKVRVCYDKMDSGERIGVARAVEEAGLCVNEALGEDPRKTMQVFSVHLSPSVRKEVVNNRSCLVCPAVAMVEGVHNNNFYGKKVLSRFPQAWNGRPVTIDHPINDEEDYVSASVDPETYHAWRIGHMFNFTYDTVKRKLEDGKKKVLGRLKGEVWVYEDALKENSMEALKS